MCPVTVYKDCVEAAFPFFGLFKGQGRSVIASVAIVVDVNVTATWTEALGTAVLSFIMSRVLIVF